MTRNQLLGNSVLWASAILASAALKAPEALTLVLLPSLAAVSWLTALPRAAKSRCKR